MSSERTIPLYYTNCGKTECQSRVVLVEEAKTQKAPGYYNVVLDETICYPQGGGQPGDSGVITKTADMVFDILDTQIIRETGIILHVGQFSGNIFKVGDIVTVKIDEKKRWLHSRFHSGGHLIVPVLSHWGLWINGRQQRAITFPKTHIWNIRERFPIQNCNL